MLDAAAGEIVASLERDGIAITDVDSFFGKPGTFARAKAAADELLAAPQIREQISEGKSHKGGKDYVVRAGANLSVDHGLTRLLMDSRLIDTVNSYLQMWSRLKNYELWYNLPVDPNSARIASQRWHRDYDDHKLIKIFIYMVDVDEQMGPFTYIRQTQPGGPYGHLFPTNPPEGASPGDDKVDRALSADLLKVCTGKAGTMIFCDTSGLHRGGRSTTVPRVLFTATYASAGAIEKDRYVIGNVGDASTLQAPVRHAIGA